MRVHLCLALAVSGCSLDWSSAQSKDGGGAGGGGGAVGGNGGAVGGSGASTNGGSGGQAGNVAAGGAAGACAANACIGEPCTRKLPCGPCEGAACPICAQVSDDPADAYCIAEGCLVSPGAAGGGGDISCKGECTDICGKFGMCCGEGVCKPLGDTTCGR